MSLQSRRSLNWIRLTGRDEERTAKLAALDEFYLVLDGVSSHDPIVRNHLRLWHDTLTQRLLLERPYNDKPSDWWSMPVPTEPIAESGDTP